MAQRENFDIHIKSKSSQDQIAQYLVKAVLCLRDRDNLSESVRLFGSGAAIPNVILVAEIIRARFYGLSSIAMFENMKKEIEENQSKKIIDIPAIRIKLTCNPTQEEMQQPGYQAPGEVKDEKKFELFQYVMIYAKNLFFSQRDNRQQRQNNNNNSNRHQGQQNEKKEKVSQFQEERGQMKSRGGAQVQRRKPDEPEQKENNKRDDRDQQRDQRNVNKRDDRDRDQRNFRQSNSNFQQQKNNDNQYRQGEIKSRGGNRK